MNRNICKRILFSALVIIAFLMLLTGCTATPSLVLIVAPDKTSYEFGEDLDLTGGKLRLTISGVDVEIQMKDNPDVTYLDYDSYVLGEQTVTVVYRYGETNLNVTFSVSVKERVQKETGIRVVAPDKFSYIEGQPFDAEGLKVFLCFEDGTETELAKGYSLSVGETVTLGDNGAVAVTYKSYKASFRIEVKKREIEELVFVKEPSKKSYRSGEKPELSDAELAYRYNDGTLESVAIDTNFKISPEVFHFGDQQIQIKDTLRGQDFPILTTDVQVNKKSTRLNVSETVKEMLRNIPKEIESAATYEKLYSEYEFFDTDFRSEEWMINGTPYSFLKNPRIKIDAASALSTSIRAFDFGDASETSKLRIHLYALLACGLNTVVIETNEEMIELVLGEEPEANYGVSNGRFVFSAENAVDENSVVHMFGKSDDALVVSVQKPLVTLHSESYVKVPSEFSPSVVWWNNAIAKEFRTDFPIERNTFPPLLPTFGLNGEADPPRILNRPL